MPVGGSQVEGIDERLAGKALPKLSPTCFVVRMEHYCAWEVCGHLGAQGAYGCKGMSCTQQMHSLEVGGGARVRERRRLCLMHSDFERKHPPPRATIGA